MRSLLVIAACFLGIMLQSCNHKGGGCELSTADSAAIYKAYVTKLAHRPPSKLLMGHMDSPNPAADTASPISTAVDGAFSINPQGTMITVDDANAQLNSFNRMH